VDAALDKPRSPADRLLPRVTGDLLEGRVDILDHSLGIRDDDLLRGLLEGQAQPLQHLLVALALRHVADDGLNQLFALEIDGMQVDLRFQNGTIAADVLPFIELGGSLLCSLDPFSRDLLGQPAVRLV
jgi:hypothetical protein